MKLLLLINTTITFIEPLEISKPINMIALLLKTIIDSIPQLKRMVNRIIDINIGHISDIANNCNLAA